jgi:hypothetical protein
VTVRQACGKPPTRPCAKEIEKFAHIIFSSSPAQREFWLGQRSGVTMEE